MNTYKLKTANPEGFYSTECRHVYSALEAMFEDEPFSDEEAVDALRMMLYMKPDRAAFNLRYMTEKGYMRKV